MAVTLQNNHAHNKRHTKCVELYEVPIGMYDLLYCQNWAPATQHFNTAALRHFNTSTLEHFDTSKLRPLELRLQLKGATLLSLPVLQKHYCTRPI